MTDRERIRRPEPARTDPVRNASSAVRGGASATDAARAEAGRAAPSNPFAWPDDDPVSRAVRAGYEVVEQAVRRGFGLGRAPSPGAAPGAASGGAPGAPWLPWDAASPLRSMSPWATGPWVDAMTSAFTMWAQWIEGWSSAARSLAGGAPPGDAGLGAWPAGVSPPSPVSSSTPAPVAAGPVQLVVELRTARAATVQLDLAPGAGGALEVHGLLAPPVAAAPPITEVTVAVSGGAVTVALGGIEQHPAGIYAGAVLAAGRACGTLTVRLA